MSLHYALLGLLNYADMTGYDLKKMFNESVKNLWYASTSQIYRELNALEKKGCLTSVVKPQPDRPDKRVYSITESGRAAFQNWIEHFPKQLSKEKRDEFTLRVFFGSNLKKTQLIREFERLKAQKRQHLEEIRNYMLLKQAYREKLKLFGGEEIYWQFILRRAVMNLETTIAWADECIQELKKEEASHENNR